VVERPAACAADLIEHPIKDAPAAFVFVEALIDKVAEEATRLRYAPAKRKPGAWQRIASSGVGVLEIADQIARARQADADHSRVARPIHDVVDAPGFEAAVEHDGVRSREAPPIARDLVRSIGRQAADQHPVFGTLRIDHGVRSVSAIGHGGGRGPRAGDEVSAYPSRDRLPAVGRNRNLHSHPAFRNVPLPPHPKQ
jgi:hypothetical protein